MPVNPALAEGFHLIDAIPSFAAGFADPQLRTPDGRLLPPVACTRANAQDLGATPP